MPAIESYDYVIVGGGSSGCVTANRLINDTDASVHILEAGHPDDHPLIRMPAGFFKFLNGSKFLTEHESVPQPSLDGRRVAIWQGNVLGGGSSVNAMVYMRGRPSDYDHWNEVAGGGWSYADMLPHFIKQEGNQRLNGPAHGIDGPLKVSDPVHTCEMSYIYLKTMQARGVRLVDDFNGGDQRGVGFMQSTTFPRARCSAVNAFLEPVRGNERLTVQTGSRATKILIENDRAVGVRYHRQAGLFDVRAERGVILASGAFITPQLLMLSGIGPADHLREHGLDVVVDAPGVGQNLHDHHEVPLIATTDRAYGYFGEDRGWRMLVNGFQYMAFRTGPVSSTGVEACSFINPDDPDADPTIKLYCVPSIYGDKDVLGTEPTHGVTFTSCVLQPKSRGEVTLRSADPMALPVVDPRYLSEPEDLRLQISALRHAREVAATRPMSDTIKDELMPGSKHTSDADLGAYCKRTVKTNWHPCGTTRMGRDDDPMAVLTPALDVRGIEGLRVHDASMMPSVPHGNTNAPTMAMADRAVDMMLSH